MRSAGLCMPTLLSPRGAATLARIRTILHGNTTHLVIDDLDVARAAVRAASEAALRLRDGPLDAEVKGSATDLVTAADHAAEAAAVELVRAERPRDGVLGEEGTLISGRATGSSTASTARSPSCAACPAGARPIALQERGQTLASAVCDPLAGELFSGGLERGADVDGTPARVGADRRLSEAVVATHVPTGDAAAAELAGLLARRAGLVRGGGSGSLELAWLACGRIDGWNRARTRPVGLGTGAILVAEAGGTVIVRGAWHIAGSPQVAAELSALVV